VRKDIKAGILDAGGLEVTYGGGAVRDPDHIRRGPGADR